MDVSYDLYLIFTFFLLALMLLGLIFEQTWNDFFYKKNFTIYKRNKKTKRNKKLIEKFNNVINELNFSQLAFFEKDSNTIYVREKLVQKGPHTVTVMNAVITVTDDEVEIKGILNWCVFFAYSAFITLGLTYSFETTIIFLLITFVITTYAYFKQMKMYDEIIKSF